MICYNILGIDKMMKQVMSTYFRCIVQSYDPKYLLAFLAIISILYLGVDRYITSELSHVSWIWKTTYISWMTYLGSGYISVLIVLGILVFRYGYLHKTYEKCCWFILSQIILTGLVCDVLKCILGRARPSLWLDHHIYGFYWFKSNSAYFSFPSGHTSTIFSIVFSLVYFLPKYRLYWYCIGIAGGFSRIACGAHYLSDVVATICLTFFVTTASYRYTLCR